MPTWWWINAYKFKENSAKILFEFSVSNKNWLLLGSYKPPSQNDLSFIILPWIFSLMYGNFYLIGNFNMPTVNPN